MGKIGNSAKSSLLIDVLSRIIEGLIKEKVFPGIIYRQLESDLT